MACQVEQPIPPIRAVCPYKHCPEMLRGSLVGVREVCCLPSLASEKGVWCSYGSTSTGTIVLTRGCPAGYCQTDSRCPVLTLDLSLAWTKRAASHYLTWPKVIGPPFRLYCWAKSLGNGTRACRPDRNQLPRASPVLILQGAGVGIPALPQLFMGQILNGDCWLQSSGFWIIYLHSADIVASS